MTKPVAVRANCTFQWMRILKIFLGILLFLWVFQSQIVPAGTQSHHHGHSHDHDDIHHHHGHSHDHHDDHDHHGHSHDSPSYKYSRQANEHAKPKETVKESPPLPPPASKLSASDVNENLWFDAIASTLLISAAPFLILFLIPLDNSKEKKHFLKILLSFASGGLLGDAFLHLIPHAIMAKGGGEAGQHDHHGHSHSHGHDGEDELHSHDMSVGLWVLVGIVTFLIVEKLIRIIKGGHHHSHGGESISHPKDSDQDEKEVRKDNTTKGKKSTNSGVPTKKSKKSKEPESDEIQVAGYLNLAADFTHNFTDGLAIGASYLAGRSVGIVTTFTILLHEVPHEIGDFAILIQSGCNKKKAIMLQLVTALGALSGTVLSLLAEGIGEAATNWILPFTAGGFIYIATVSVIPELLQQSTIKQSVNEILALFAGIYMMVLIAKYE